MSDWPGDTAPLPHQAPEDRLGARLAGMVAREGERANVAPLRRCRACGNRPAPMSWVAAFWDAGAA